MKTLRIYVQTTTGHKKDFLYAFGRGAAKHGIKVDYTPDLMYKPSDYAMIFAYKSYEVKSQSHNLRNIVVDKKIDKQIFFVDSNVLKYYEDDIRYFRFPYKSIHPHQADFLDIDENSIKKVDQIKKDLRVSIKDWRKTGNHILLCLNRGIGGFSTFGKPCYEWAKETVLQLRKYTDRPIVIRSHNIVKNNPALEKDLENLNWILQNIKNVSHTKFGSDDLKKDLENAWATVVFTTTSGAVSLVEGVPVFTTHPACFFHKFSAGSISDIENPNYIERDNFLVDFANAHWTIKEVENGEYWDKFKRQRI